MKPQPTSHIFVEGSRKSSPPINPSILYGMEYRRKIRFIAQAYAYWLTKQPKKEQEQ